MNTRRQFLRSSTALIALPFLESFGFRRFAAAAAPATPPKRLIFLGMGYGVTKETWYPDVKQTGSDYVLPPGLAPLARHKADFTVIQGLSNRYSEDAHTGSTFWLTGANSHEGGASFRNTISADQVAAAAFGKETRFASLQLNGSDKDLSGPGHGTGLSLAWDNRGKPIAGLNSPLALFHRLFSPEQLPLDQLRLRMAQKRSLLDAVLTEAQDLQRGLAKNDIEKLDEYFQGIREIEQRLAKDETWQSAPKPTAPLAQPPDNRSGTDEIRLMYDLMVAALQTDSTRVLTFRLPIASLLTSLGVKVAAHDMSHYSPGERMEASQKRDAAHTELLAHLLDKLKGVPQPDGSRLFDHTTVVFGSNLSHVHTLTNCPTLIAGGGAGIQLGQHLVVSKDTPLCNAWLSLLQGSGVPVERHGDSSGPLKELFA
ncbi:MAG: hypothetical protein RLZZ244_314 [Verrucomicrobiota bacterium]